MTPAAGERVRVGGLVLAAGLSRRFGGSKLLATFRGRALVDHVLGAASSARRLGVISSVHVVVAAGTDAIATLARGSGASVVVNPHPARGLSSSLKLGLAALPPDIDSALLLLGDQPLVRLEVMEALVASRSGGGGDVIRPRYANSPDIPGHPVLLGREAWPLIAGLEGDAGLGVLLASGATGVTFIDVPGGNPGVDTPADLLSLKDSRP